jgi:hypothetical protein
MLVYILIPVAYIIGFYVGYMVKNDFNFARAFKRREYEIRPLTKEARQYMDDIIQGRRISTLVDLDALAERFNIDEEEIKKAYKVRQSDR